MSDHALWQAVYDAPDDDSPRAVLADVLQERGDPRGELIALQLREHAGQASNETCARAMQLVKEHGEQWLGALRPITSYATLRRGFLDRISLVHVARSKNWDALLDDPAFATVEEINLSYHDTLFARVMRSAASANLRSISIEYDSAWKDFIAHVPPRLERLTCTRWVQLGGFAREAYETGFLDHVLPFVERTPRITTLGLGLEMVPRLSPELRVRLTGLEFRAGLDEALRVWDELPALRSLVFTQPFANYQFNHLELVRTADGEHVRIDHDGVTYGVTHGQACESLLRIPGRFTTLELVGNKALAKYLRRHYAARFTVTARPAPSSTCWISIR